MIMFFFFSSRRRHTRCSRDWSSDVCSSDLEAVGINPVVVHGGGKAITRAMEAAGLKANFIQGQRVTDEATVQVVEQVLSREINPEVVKTVNELGGKARGFSGTEIFTCRKLWLNGS